MPEIEHQISSRSLAVVDEQQADDSTDNGEDEVMQDSFLRYVNTDLEIQFVEFLRPNVSASLVFILLLMTVAFVFLARTSQDTIPNAGPLYNGIMILAIFVCGVATVWQVGLVIFSRGGSWRVGELNRQSEWLIVAFVLGSGIASRASVTYTTTVSNCSDLHLYVYKSSGDHGYYDDALCERQFASLGIVLAFFVAVRRQRFVTVVALSAIIVVANIILAFILPKHRTFPAYHWLLLVFYVGMLSFACVVRYSFETAERRYFEAHHRLQTKRQLLEQLSAEDEAFVQNLLPPAIVARSSRTNAAKIDRADDAIVVVLSLENFTSILGELLPMRLSTQLSMLHRVSIDFAEKRGLYKVLSLNDELVFVANLIERRGLSHGLVAAIDAALDSVGFSDLDLRLRGAVHVGPLRGGFQGGNWIRYDVDGRGLDEARAACHHAAAGKIVLTDDALHATRENVVVRAMHSADENESTTLWEVENCVAPESLENSALFTMLSTEEKASNDAATNPLAGLHAVAEATKAVISEDDRLAVEPTWLIFHRFVNPDVEAAYLEIRMTTMAQRASRIWCAFAWLQLVFVVVLISDFFPHSGEVALLLLCVSMALTLVVALVPTRVSAERMNAMHTPWSLLAILTPLLTTFAISASRPSAIGIDPRPMMMVGALLRVPCLYYERHQLVVIPPFVLLSVVSFVLPGGGLQLWTIVYIALALYVIVTSSESDHAQRRNFVAEGKLLLTLDALEGQQRVRWGLVRASLPAPILARWAKGGLVMGKSVACQVPETVALCISARQFDGTSAPTAADRVGFTTERLLPVERAAAESKVLHIVKVVGDLCLLISPVVIPGEDIPNRSRVTMESISNVLVVLLDLCRDGNYGALLDLDTSIQVLNTTTGIPSFSVYGVVWTRMLAIAAATNVAWSGLRTLDRNMGSLHASCPDLKLVEEPQPPLRIRGVGMLRLVKLSQ